MGAYSLSAWQTWISVGDQPDTLSLENSNKRKKGWLKRMGWGRKVYDDEIERRTRGTSMIVPAILFDGHTASGVFTDATLYDLWTERSDTRG